jgi:hypothetical protein
MPDVGDVVVAGSEIFQPYLLMVAEIVVVDYEGEKSVVDQRDQSYWKKQIR